MRVCEKKKLEYLCSVLDSVFPDVMGDEVTFIGSTFMKIDEDEPYLNHGICLGDCEEDMDIGFGRCEIECYELLLLDFGGVGTRTVSTFTLKSS